MLPERKQRILDTVKHRQPDLTVLLDNVHDTHNISAVLRSCDAVGIPEIYILDTNPEHPVNKIKLGKRSSAGARKWVDVHLFRDFDTCLARIRKKYKRILISDISDRATDLYDTNLTESCALVFGNEHTGISQQMRDAGDGVFTIPMYGMVASLNISVACAVTLFEAMRQRKNKGFYDNGPDRFAEQRQKLLDSYNERQARPDALTYLVRPKKTD